MQKFHEEELKMIPYKQQNYLALRYGDGGSFLGFALYFCTQLSTSRSFLKRTVFSECKVLLTGRVNKKKCRVWGTEQPNQMHEVLLHLFPLWFGAQLLNMKQLGLAFSRTKT